VWIRDVYADRGIVFTTDRRSEKMQHLRAQPMGELCWWFPMQKEQFRITAHCTLVDSSHPSAALQQLRTALWKASPDWLQRSFSNPPPGQPVGIKAEDRAGGEEESGDVSGMSAEFVVVVLWPVACDYLRLPVTVVDNSRPLHRESRLQPQKEQQRWLHTRHSGSSTAAVHWTVTQVNP
jgi:hypothetical protein